MNKKARPSKFTAKQSGRLGAYFAAGVGASMLATPNSDAAIVGINIGSGGFDIGEINGGLASGGRAIIYNFPVSFYGAGGIQIDNAFNFYDFAFYTGLTTFGVGPQFGVNSPDGASPRNFSGGEYIGSDSLFSPSISSTTFRVNLPAFPEYSRVAPDFGPGSYLGFVFQTSEEGYNYGWLEVTWSGASNQFQILAGAYETILDKPIRAGDTGAAAIPEPGTWAAAALLAGGAAFARWRKRRDESLKEAA